MSELENIMDVAKSWSEWREEQARHKQIAQITDAERRISEKKNIIYYLNCELDLLIQDVCRNYRHEYDYHEFNLLIPQAMHWLSMLSSGKDMNGDKLDKRKKYLEKSAFDLLTDKLRSYMSAPDLTIHKICEFNYGEGTNIYFTYAGHTWELTVPIPSRVSQDSYEARGNICFQLLVSRAVSEHCYSSVGSTFYEDELAAILQKGLEDAADS